MLCKFALGQVALALNENTSTFWKSFKVFLSTFLILIIFYKEFHDKYVRQSATPVWWNVLGHILYNSKYYSKLLCLVISSRLAQNNSDFNVEEELLYRA